MKMAMQPHLHAIITLFHIALCGDMCIHRTFAQPSVLGLELLNVVSELVPILLDLLHLLPGGL